jgi:Tol biopolymer transport system component
MVSGRKVDVLQRIRRRRVPSVAPALPNGAPEQITLDTTTEEEGIAVAPDSRSLITSLGVRESSVWIHDARGDHSISYEGRADSPHLSADEKRVYYLLQSSPASPSKGLYVTDLGSGTAERLLPEVSLESFQLSRDEKEVVFTKRQGNSPSEIWLATLDRRSPPRLITRAGDEVFFMGEAQLIFRGLGKNANFLFRINRDGSGRQRVLETPIVSLRGVSPDGSWTVTSSLMVSTDELPHTFAMHLDGGETQRICAADCHVHVQW